VLVGTKRPFRFLSHRISTYPLKSIPNHSPRIRMIGRGYVDIPSSQPANNPRTRNRRMADGYHILELCFKDTVLVSINPLSPPSPTSFHPNSHHSSHAQAKAEDQEPKNIPVEILTRTHSNQRITICQRREDTDPISY
jgi:hypothetical protein